MHDVTDVTCAQSWFNSPLTTSLTADIYKVGMACTMSLCRRRAQQFPYFCSLVYYAARRHQHCMYVAGKQVSPVADTTHLLRWGARSICNITTSSSVAPIA